METKNLKCECNIISSEIKVTKSEDFSSKSLYKSFYDVLKFSNYKVLKCFKLVFNINIFNTNIGNYIALAYFCIFFTFFLIYMIRGRTELKNELAKNIINNGTKDINYIAEILNLNIEERNNIDDSGRKMKLHDLSKNMKGIDSNNKTINISKKVKINKFNNNDIYNRLYMKKDMKKDINRKKIKPKILFDFPPKKIILKKRLMVYINKTN